MIFIQQSHDKVENIVYQHYEQFDQTRKQAELDQSEKEAIDELMQIAIELNKDKIS